MKGRACQHCGRPCVFIPPHAGRNHRRNRRVSDKDHDLCRQCYIALMNSVWMAQKAEQRALEAEVTTA